MRSWAGKQACVVITTDDGWLPTLQNLYELSKEYPYIRTTNYIITGDESEFANNENWSTYKSNPQILTNLIDKGHEIGSHTHDHLNLTMLSDTELTGQVKNSYDALMSLGMPLPYTIGYPYGTNPSPNKYNLINPYYILGRDTAQQNSLIFLNNTQIDETSTFSPFDAYKVSCRNAGWDYDNETEEDWFNRMKSYINDAIDNNACVFLLFHYIDEDLRTGYGTIKTSMIRRFYNFLSSVKNQLWIPTAKQFYKAYTTNDNNSIPSPILNVQVTEISENENKVSWELSSEPDVVDYMVTCNGIEIGRTYHNEFVHTISNHENLHYNVYAINIRGRMSISNSGGLVFTSELAKSEIKIKENLMMSKNGYIRIGNNTRYIKEIYIKNTNV